MVWLHWIVLDFLNAIRIYLLKSTGVEAGVYCEAPGVQQRNMAGANRFIEGDRSRGWSALGCD